MVCYDLKYNTVHACIHYQWLITLPTWLTDRLLIVHVTVVPEELGKGSIVLNELSVSACLSYSPLHQHHNPVKLRQEHNAVGHQDASL